MSNLFIDRIEMKATYCEQCLNVALFNSRSCGLASSWARWNVDRVCLSVSSLWAGADQILESTLKLCLGYFLIYHLANKIMKNENNKMSEKEKC